MLSLLHRYGDRHGLRFALPIRYQFGYPRLFQASWVKGYHPQGGGTQPPFHILCHHMRFNLKEVSRCKGGGWDWRDVGSGLWTRPSGEEAAGLGVPRCHFTQKLGMGAMKVRFSILLSLAVPTLVALRAEFLDSPIWNSLVSFIDQYILLVSEPCQL